ncbi:MAG: hypothetical protein JWO94_1240 [Verrucomicrobiaceae bacterium]|nr:hypothetical protein [Verrucomicrobiaceae bacterium]
MQRFRHSVARNPLAYLALAAMAGIATVDACEKPQIQPWCLALAAVLAGWCCLKPATWRLLLAAAVTFGFIHTCRLGATRFHPLRTLLQPGQKAEVIASGRFDTAPMAAESPRTPGRREARFHADALIVPSHAALIHDATELRVWLKDSSLVSSGGRYELRGTLSMPAPSANPSLYDPERGALRQGFVADVTAREVRPEGPAEFSLQLWLLGLAEQSRHWIESALALGLEGDDKPRILIQTMALGINEPGSTELQEPFRDSGTLHVFAVSGLHVSMLAWIGWMMLHSLGLRRSAAMMVLIPMVLAYAFITGWRPSAARAALMTCTLLCAPLFNRRSRPINVLGGCALGLLACDTQQLFQAGFQLSFGVVWAIAAGARLAAKPFGRLASLDPFMPAQLASRWQRFSLWVRRELIAITAVSLVATIASLPIMLMEFHSATPVGVAANCVLVPLSFISLLAVTLSLMAAGCGVVRAQVLFNNANWLFVKVMTACATWFAAIPGGNFNMALAPAPSSPPVTLSVLAMPPGEGAQLLEASGKRWLLDCGGASHCGFTLLPFLRHQGINSLDGILLSHADSEHIGALEELMPRFHPPVVLTSILEPWRLDSRATLMHKLFAGHALDTADAGKLKAGDIVTVGQARIHILYPCATDLYNKADDRAIVARIDCGKMRVLWCNDAGFITEKRLLSRFPPAELRCQALIRNQHASDFSALPEFLMAVSPRLVITSNSPAVVDQRLPSHLTVYCNDHQVPLFDQSEAGMVRLDIWPDHAEAKTWLTGVTLSLQP